MLASGKLRYPRFKPAEVAASQGDEHGKLWHYILSLESAKVDGGRASSLVGGKESFSERVGETLRVVSELGSRLRGDPRFRFGVDHKFLDKGVESNVYDDGDGYVSKLRQIRPHSINDVIDILSDVVYHNYLFPNDAYIVRDIIDTGEDGQPNLYLVLDQKMVTPKTDVNGNIVAPTYEQIFAALHDSPMRFRVLDENARNSDSDDSDSDDVVPAAKYVAYNGDFMVYDFQPGRNTFIDAKTGKVRFIDPRVKINAPGEPFAASKYGKRKVYTGNLDIAAGHDINFDSLERDPVV